MICTTVIGASTGCATAEVTGGQDGDVTVIDVTPAQTTLIVGETAQLDATPRASVGGPAVTCDLEWESGNATVASVSAAGLVTALAAGSAAISATCGEVSGQATVFVLTAGASVDTLFSDDFESGTLGDAGRWHDVYGSGATMVDAAAEGIGAISGSRVLRLAPTGTAMTHFVATGSSSPYERLHLSFYLYRTSAYQEVNPGLRAGGIRGSTTQWGSFGVGWGTPGSCPDDPDNVTKQEFMFAYVFNAGGSWALRTYTNWLGQKKLTEDPPTCGGGYAMGAGNQPEAIYHDPNFVPSVDAWHRYEIEVRLNDVGQANGWQRMWVDGVLKIEHLDVVYRTTSGMKLWAVTFDTGTIHGGALYLDDVLVSPMRSP